MNVTESIEHAGADGPRALQLDRMRTAVRRAYKHVPHYRTRFDAAGVRPDDLRRLEDLSRFPLTAKEDLRQNYSFGMFAVPMEQIVRIHASSGTTGKPTVVGYTRKDIDTWSMLMGLWEDHFYPEIIDSATGLPVPDGPAGELVLTTLTKEAMPVIRYRTRDLTRLLPPATRAMRRIDRISGRSDDMLIIRGVNVFPSSIEAALAQEDRFAPPYLLELRRPGSLDELDVVVETRTALADLDMAALERRGEHLIKSFVGITTKVRVVEPGTLERSQGKAKRVVDLRPKD